MKDGTLHIAIPREQFGPLWRSGWQAVVAASKDAGWTQDKSSFQKENHAVVYEGKLGVPYLWSQGW